MCPGKTKENQLFHESRRVKDGEGRREGRWRVLRNLLDVRVMTGGGVVTRRGCGEGRVVGGRGGVSEGPGGGRREREMGGAVVKMVTVVGGGGGKESLIVVVGGGEGGMVSVVGVGDGERVIRTAGGGKRVMIVVALVPGGEVVGGREGLVAAGGAGMNLMVAVGCVTRTLMAEEVAGETEVGHTATFRTQQH